MSAERRDHLRESTQKALRPLTVRQALSVSQVHSTADFILDDIVVNKVTLVAHVVNVVLDESGKTQKFFLEDGSAGRLVAQRWLDSTHEFFEEIPSNCYVRVVGALDRFRDVNSLKIYTMRRVTDMHEPFHHLLEAMIASLWYERGPPEPVNQCPDPGTQGKPPTPPPTASQPPAPSPSPTPSRPPTRSQSPPQSPRAPEPSRASAPSQSPTPSRPPATVNPPAPAHTEQDYTQPQESESAGAQPNQVDGDGDGLSTTDQSEDKDEFYSVPPSPSPSPEPSPRSEHASPQLSAHYHWRDPYSDLSTLQRSIMLSIHNNTIPSERSGVSLDVIVRGLAHTSVTSGEIG
ncbi:nucleic acid-binding protein [Dentipellis sp. KUC8613]|nr:nucleic acid-binding protein [Dentipellis sp. KUC8613]